jgi:choline dehydrogenase-like flavoprotein
LHPAFLEVGDDLDVLLRGVRETRRVMAAEPLASYLGAEIKPGSEAQSDAELKAAIRSGLTTVYHPVGTCKMGPSSDSEAVVDSTLRVYGTSRLRVADASIMPTIIGGNTSAPVMMIGERAADFILRRNELSPTAKVESFAT